MTLFGLKGLQQGLYFSKRFFLWYFVTVGDSHGLLDRTLIYTGHLQLLSVVLLVLLRKKLRLAYCNSHLTTLIIALALKWRLLILYIAHIWLFTVTPIGVNLKIIKILTVCLPLKVIKDYFQFFLIKTQILLTLFQKACQTVP